MGLLRPHSGGTRLTVVAPGIVASETGGFLRRGLYTQKTYRIHVGRLAFLDFCLYTQGMSTTRKKRLGRPPKGSDKIRNIRLDMRLEATEKEGFRAAAELAGLDLSAWIRERLRRIARDELKEAGRPVPFLQQLNHKE
jgi:hypothetical protein